MKPARAPALLVLAALTAAAILASAPSAPARAPSAADQGSMDWVQLRFARDREEEGKGGGTVDPVAAFRTRDAALEGDAGWKAMLGIVLATAEKPPRKLEAAAAVVERFRLEDEAKAVDPKVLWEIKKQVCRDTLTQRGMLSSNPVVLGCVLRIQKALLPTEWVTWKETDNLKIRKRAYDDLVKKLK